MEGPCALCSCLIEPTHPLHAITMGGFLSRNPSLSQDIKDCGTAPLQQMHITSLSRNPSGMSVPIPSTHLATTCGKRVLPMPDSPATRATCSRPVRLSSSRLQRRANSHSLPTRGCFSSWSSGLVRIPASWCGGHEKGAYRISCLEAALQVSAW